MATFIEVRTDAFAANVDRVKQGGFDYSGVRRPFRGIEIKDDTYGIIRVMKANGDEIPLVDAGGPHAPKETDSTGSKGNERSGYTTTNNYSNFIIQQVQDSRQEKQQILETFGDSYVFFFGERPRVLSVSGLLMNTRDFNWRTEFWYNYENTLRGTKLVELGARVYLHWDDIVVEGYILEAMARDDANTPYHIPFTFQMFVTNHTYLSQVGDDNYPIAAAVNVEPLLRQKDAEAAKDRLKQRDVNKSQSNITEVQRAHRNTSDAQLKNQVQGLSGLLDSGNEVNRYLGLPDTSSKFLYGKAIMANALAVGVHAQNLTFLSVVNRLFRARKMRLPRGIAGMFSYIGPPQYAGMKTEWGEGPRRTEPLRSKIRDNKDEYIGTADGGGDKSSTEWSEEQNTSKTEYDMEKVILTELELAGINPVQHPGGSLTKNKHALGGYAGAIQETALLQIGFTVAAGRQEINEVLP